MRMLAVGDINVDIMMGGLASLPVVDKEVPCQSFEVTMGSAAVIFACAYSCLGGRISFLGLAGRDDYGDFMLRGMQEMGVGTELVRKTDQVRTGVTVNLIYRNTRTQVTYPGTIAEFEAGGIDEPVLSRFAHVHLAGPYQQTRFRPQITELLGRAQRLGLSTSLDPQWDAQEEWEYMDQWLPLLDYLFVNEDEATSISGEAETGAACKRLAQRTRCPVVKRGAEGVLLQIEGELTAIPTTRVSVVDTTGAGDTFDAAFLFGVLDQGMALAEAARFATAAATRSCLFVGGVNARSKLPDVREFMTQGAAR